MQVLCREGLVGVFIVKCRLSVNCMAVDVGCVCCACWWQYVWCCEALFCWVRTCECGICGAKCIFLRVVLPL